MGLVRKWYGTLIKWTKNPIEYYSSHMWDNFKENKDIDKHGWEWNKTKYRDDKIWQEN